MKDDPVYIIFARRPEAGKVKRRLAESVGASAAAELYSAFLGDTLAAVRRTGRPFAIGCTPAGSVGWFRALAPDAAEVFAQEGGDLGERMASAFARFFRRGYRRIVLVGSDTPLLNSGILLQAGDSLEQSPAVLGPCRDGGYYLVGLDRPLPELFSGIVWGSGSVLAKTRETLEKLGIGFSLLPELYDIDTAADLARLKRDLTSDRGDGVGSPGFTIRALAGADGPGRDG